GVTEAFNDREEEFSEERLRQVVTAHGGGAVKETARAVMENVKAFTGDVPQSDDIAILALKYLLKAACEPT
ncbi:MAG: SpoIIE family protein phosphatase, partial [Desulfobacterales bacterium]|nr:SpoIIE family protein phosphatase [Desulfobacterales bacterium]